MLKSILRKMLWPVQSKIHKGEYMLDVMVLEIGSKEDDFNMDMEIEFNQLNVLVGMNGSGKTLIMKFAWFAGYMLQVYKVTMATENEKTEEVFAGLMQNVFNWTFDETGDITGTISVHDKTKEKFNFNVTFEEGRLSNFTMDVINPKEFTLSTVQGVQFNSKTARTFDNYAQYLKIKKLNNITILTPDSLNTICEYFKLYDVVWFENVYRKVKDMIDNGLSPRITEGAGRGALSTIFAGADAGPSDRYLVSIKEQAGNEGMPIFVMDDGSEKKALRLSSGQQSMLMMTLML